MFFFPYMQKLYLYTLFAVMSGCLEPEHKISHLVIAQSVNPVKWSSIASFM